MRPYTWSNPVCTGKEEATGNEEDEDEDDVSDEEGGDEDSTEEGGLLQLAKPLVLPQCPPNWQAGSVLL